MTIEGGDLKYSQERDDEHYGSDIHGAGRWGGVGGVSELGPDGQRRLTSSHSTQRRAGRWPVAASVPLPLVAQWLGPARSRRARRRRCSHWLRANQARDLTVFKSNSNLTDNFLSPVLYPNHSWNTLRVAIMH